jgi:hypothetical protein
MAVDPLRGISGHEFVFILVKVKRRAWDARLRTVVHCLSYEPKPLRGQSGTWLGFQMKGAREGLKE